MASADHVNKENQLLYYVLEGYRIYRHIGKRGIFLHALCANPHPLLGLRLRANHQRLCT